MKLGKIVEMGVGWGTGGNIIFCSTADVVVSFKAIAGNNKFMHGVIGFKESHTTYVKWVLNLCLHLLHCILTACLDILLTRSPSINASCWLHSIGCV